MVTTLTYPVCAQEQNHYSIEHLEGDGLEEAMGLLVQAGICPAGQSKEVARRAIMQLKTKYAGQDALKLPALWNAFLNFAALEIRALQRQMDQNFGLTEEAFGKMSAELLAGDKTMFKLVFLAHFASCRDYLIVNYNASAEDAYDATMDTLVEFHHRLLDGKIRYGNLRYLFTKMATQIYQKTRRKNSKVGGLEDERIAAMADENAYDQEAENLLLKAWVKLGDGCQKILKAFYYDNTNLNVLAEEQGKDHAAMRKQKQRCVESLRLNFIRFS